MWKAWTNDCLERSFNSPSLIKVPNDTLTLKSPDYPEYTYEERRKINNGLELHCLNSVDLSQSKDKPSARGKCLNCGNPTGLRCYDCEGPYCSSDCQETHWPLHKSTCLLSRLNDSEAVKNDRPFSNQISKIKYTSLKNRPNAEMSLGSKCHYLMDNSESEAPNYHKPNMNTHVGSNPERDRKCEPNIFENRKNVNDRLRQSGTSEAVNVSLDSSIKTNVKAKVNAPVMGTEKLPKDVFVKVKVTVRIGCMLYWVQLDESKEKILDVAYELNKGSSSPLSKVEPGMFCAALYKGIWFRGRVTTVEPKLKVFYIDYGNEEICELDKLKTISPSVENIPALAIRIQLAEGTSSKYSSLKEDQMLSVKCVEEKNNTFIVHVEGESYEKEIQLEKQPTKSSGSYTAFPRPKENIESLFSTPVVKSLKEGSKGIVQFRQVLDGNDFGVSVVCDKSRAEYLQLHTSLVSFHRSPACGNYRPVDKEIVAALVQNSKNEKSWVRACVLSFYANFYIVNLVDYGMVAMSEKIRRLPKDLASYPEYGARCTFNRYVNFEKEKCCSEEMKCTFDVTCKHKALGLVSCNVKLEDKAYTVMLSPWKPSDFNIKIMLLRRNPEVVLKAFYDTDNICLRPVSDMFKRLLARIQEDMQKHCATASKMNYPKIGHIVGCKFRADDLYYRAKILEMDDDRALVFFIDYGDMDSVDRKELKFLSADLKKFPGLCLKCGLRNCIKNPNSQAVNTLLMSLLSKEVEMKVSFAELLQDGVDLILPNDQTLNETLNKMFCSELENIQNGERDKKKESTKQLPAGKSTEPKTLMESDLNYLQLPVGKKIDLIVLHKLDSFLFMGCDANRETMRYVHSTLMENMNKYCESISCEYSPKSAELCFAKFEDGLWYRALCISDRFDEENIFFVDFGNIACIDKSNIRKMTEEYAEIPALAVLCAVQDFSELDFSESKKKKIGGLIKVNKIYKALILSVDCLGNYTVDLPYVTNALKQMDIKLQ